MELSSRWTRFTQRFDLYGELPKDFRETTLSGAIVSLLCVVVILYLFLSELVLYLTPEIESTMFIDQSAVKGNEIAMVNINMDITLPKLPCVLVSVDVQDAMGTHIMDVHGQLHKVRLNADGKPKFPSANDDHINGEGTTRAKVGGHRHSHGGGKDGGGGEEEHDHIGENYTLEQVKEQTGEGCRLVGNMMVKRVPGNFHISAHAHPRYLDILLPTSNMNVSHTINHLWFGDTNEKDAFAGVQGAVLNPLEGITQTSLDNDEPKSYEYYIEIVPTQFQRLSGKVHSAYQFVANHMDNAGRFQMPVIFFRYQISAVTVRFKERQKSFAHFLVQLCAIVGGVFTVFGFVAGFLNSGVKFIEKVKMGKNG